MRWATDGSGGLGGRQPLQRSRLRIVQATAYPFRSATPNIRRWMEGLASPHTPPASNATWIGVLLWEETIWQETMRLLPVPKGRPSPISSLYDANCGLKCSTPQAFGSQWPMRCRPYSTISTSSSSTASAARCSIISRSFLICSLMRLISSRSSSISPRASFGAMYGTTGAGGS